MVHQKTEAIARVVSIGPNPSYPGFVELTVRCPFCGAEHGHGASERDVLLGVPVHRVADNCWPFDMELGRKGLRKKRQRQLEEGLALRKRCGGKYFIPLREAREMRIRKGRAKA